MSTKPVEAWAETRNGRIKITDDDTFAVYPEGPLEYDIPVLIVPLGTWAGEMPTEPGWYWVSHKGGKPIMGAVVLETVSEILDTPEGPRLKSIPTLYYKHGCYRGEDLARFELEIFSQPIPMPDPPTKDGEGVPARTKPSEVPEKGGGDSGNK